MKTCPRCSQTKPPEDFYLLKKGPRAGRLSGYCKSCTSEKRAARMKERYQTDPEYRAHRLATHKAWLAKNPQKRERWARAAWLRRRYGITIEAYEAVLKAQGGVCAICKGRDQNGHRLAVDHCHETGRIRGLLCDHCNRAIGLVHDDARIAASLAAYLALEHPHRTA